MLPSRIFLDSVFNDLNDESKMKCDIYEQDDTYHIEVDIPGFNKENIKLEINNGYLTVTALREKEEIDKSKKYIRRERRITGKYQRSFYLDEADEENINASFKNGILNITVPKKKVEVSKKYIEIE